MSIQRYGVTFPDGVSDVSIELHCYRWGAASAGEDFIPCSDGSESWQHLYRAIKGLWPEKLPDGRKGYIESPWTIPRVKAWCELGPPGMTHDCWWGPSSTGKTTDAAIIILADWLSAPDRTCTHVTSTDINGLKMRIFGEIAKFHGMHGGNLPGEVKMSVPCLTLGGEDSKAVIFGHAVNAGNQMQSMNKLIGLHNEFNRLIVDEMQGSLAAASDAAVNLSSGREFRFLGMGNPQSRLDPLGRHSKPVAGWESVNPSMTEWKTDYGKVHYFDGLKSPALVDPKKYFFLLTQQMIDDTVRIYGVNSFQYWSQRRGWIPPEGLVPTVMSEAFIEKYKMMEKATWKDSFKIAAGFDPAYSSGGDRALFYPFEYGIMDNDIWAMHFLEPISIELGSVGDKLMSQHITDQLQVAMKGFGMQPSDLAMDCTGMQGALADYIEDKLGRGILRVLFGGKASELPVETGSDVIGKTQYKNRVTELWYSMNYFGLHGHVRGLSAKSAVEFTQRRLDESGTPMCIESKKDYKLRTGGESPDESDAAVCAVEYVRVKLGILPAPMNVPGDSGEDWRRIARQSDIDSNPDNYLCSDL